MTAPSETPEIVDESERKKVIVVNERAYMVPLDVFREIQTLRIKNAGTLANNLCPDHRDKQVEKPCLACEVETLERRLREVQGERDFAHKAQREAENWLSHEISRIARESDERIRAAEQRAARMREALEFLLFTVERHIPQPNGGINPDSPIAKARAALEGSSE